MNKYVHLISTPHFCACSRAPDTDELRQRNGSAGGGALVGDVLRGPWRVRGLQLHQCSAARGRTAGSGACQSRLAAEVTVAITLRYAVAKDGPLFRKQPSYVPPGRGGNRDEVDAVTRSGGSRVSQAQGRPPLAANDQPALDPQVMPQLCVQPGGEMRPRPWRELPAVPRPATCLLLASSRCVAMRGSRLASALRGTSEGAACVHADDKEGRQTLLSTSNLYRTRGLHEAPGHAA